MLNVSAFVPSESEKTLVKQILEIAVVFKIDLKSNDLIVIGLRVKCLNKFEIIY